MISLWKVESQSQNPEFRIDLETRPCKPNHEILVLISNEYIHSVSCMHNYIGWMWSRIWRFHNTFTCLLSVLKIVHFTFVTIYFNRVCE